MKNSYYSILISSVEQVIILIGFGFQLLVPSDRAVICHAVLRSYLPADFIERYINKLILYYRPIILLQV